MSVAAARHLASKAKTAPDPQEAVKYIERAIDELGKHIAGLEERVAGSLSRRRRKARRHCAGQARPLDRRLIASWELRLRVERLG